MKRALALFAAFALPACNGSPLAIERTGDEFVGKWAQQRREVPFDTSYIQYVNISRDGSTFIVNFHATARSGMSGTYTATYENGMLRTSMPMLGDIGYMPSAKRITVAGEQFSRDDISQNAGVAPSTETNAIDVQ